MPKHILLAMAIRHLAERAKLITITNRYGHGQYYTTVLKVEATLCIFVLVSVSVLPVNRSADNNIVLYSCWDNFDLNEEMPSYFGTTQTTHGITIQ